MRVTIYGKTPKHVSVICVLKQFLNANSMVMSVWQSEWPYMATPLNMWVVYVFWSDFSMWIQWWCPFHDQSDHKTENRSTCKCYICSEAVFHCEFNGNVHFTIRVTIYGKTTKHVHVILFCGAFGYKANGVGESNHQDNLLTCLEVLPYMVTLIAKWTSPLNSHWKTTSEHI